MTSNCYVPPLVSLIGNATSLQSTITYVWLAVVNLFQNVHYERNMSDITGLELWPFVNGDPINRQIVDSFDCSLYDEFRLQKVHRFT